MARTEVRSLRGFVTNAPAPRYLRAPDAEARYTDLVRGTIFGGRLDGLAGRSVLLATGSQITTALALVELDGCARRLLILPPDADPSHLDAVVSAAGIDAVVLDDVSLPLCAALDLPVRVTCAPTIAAAGAHVRSDQRTEWVLMTSGTTGVPKLVAHDLSRLTSALHTPSPADGATAWGTFYDIRRYGGLQIFLRAVLGGASLVLSGAGEPIADHLARLGQHGVTHLSGTPSHWRRALMNPAMRKIRAALCAPLGRDLRSGGAGPAARGISAGHDRPCLRFDRSRRRLRRQ